MTDRFLDNFTPGDGTDGLTWAKAELTLAALTAVDVAGDRLLIDSRHSEATAGSLGFGIAGNGATPSQILSVTQSGASGFSALTSGAIISTTTGITAIQYDGSFYMYGVSNRIGVGGSSSGGSSWANVDGNIQLYDNCDLQIATTHASTSLQIGSTSNFSAGRITWKDFNVKFAATGQFLSLGHVDFRWSGGAVISGGTTPTALFNIAHDAASAFIENVDFSNFASTVNLVSTINTFAGKIVFRNCKMPSSWSGNIGVVGAPAGRVEAYNVGAAVASGANNFSLWIEDYSGNIKHETTIVRTGGASDGDTPVAWKFASGTGAEYPLLVLRSPEIAIPLTTTGSKTFTVHWVSDENVAAGQGAGTGNAFRDDEVWLEVRVLGTTDSPQGSFGTGMVGLAGTPADHAASTETWTTTGLTTPQKQKAAVTITNNEECVAFVTICVAKASKTIYFCPKVEVS